jgi:hypothetical protein
MEASVFFRVVHSFSDIDNLRSDDTCMLHLSHFECVWQFWYWSFLSFLKVCFPQNMHSAMSIDMSSVCLFSKGTCDVSGLWSEPGDSTFLPVYFQGQMSSDICKILFALVKVKQSVQVVVCVLSKGCFAPSQPNCKEFLGGTRGRSEQLLSYAPRVINRLVYKSWITQ